MLTKVFTNIEVQGCVCATWEKRGTMRTPVDLARFDDAPHKGLNPKLVPPHSPVESLTYLHTHA